MKGWRQVRDTIKDEQSIEGPRKVLGNELLRFRP